MKNILKAVSNYYKIHILVWVIFIGYEILVTSISMRRFTPDLTYIVYYSLNIFLFYFNAVLYYKILNKYWLIPLLIIFEILIYCLLIFYAEKFMIAIKIIDIKKTLEFNMIFFSRALWRSLYFIGFSTGFVYIVKAIEESKYAEALKTQNLINTLDNQRLENELVKVENNFLRSQINPHFLFNTLNFIYNNTRKKAPEAASAILSLSDMMRYALKQPTSSETTYLKDEIEQVENLINLHKLRTKDGIFLELNVTGDIAVLKFLPLILLTLVENVFKHGNVTNENAPAEINIIYTDNNLTISTKNQIAEYKKGESNKIGMENISKRLNSYYKENATLSSKTDGTTYETTIFVTNI